MRAGDTPPDADGKRPALGWVGSLPHSWTTGNGRHVLTWLALDAYTGETGRPPNSSGASLAALSQWTGLYKDAVTTALQGLRLPNGSRGALLVAWVERPTPTGKEYRKLGPDETNRGGKGVRTLHQLQTDICPENPGQLERSTPAPGSAETVRGNRPGKPSGETVRDSPDTPIPFPFPPHSSSYVTTEGSPAVDAMNEGAA